ncbi:MAG: adenylyl-sulfate kinase [Sandaracinus sp.]
MSGPTTSASLPSYELAPGPIVWLTGLPSAGKSTLARAVAEQLRGLGRRDVVVLDSDVLRAALRPAPGYDEAARDAFYESLARIAALLAAEGLVVLVPATAHKRAFRARARALAPGRFVEVWLDTDLETCRARDAKGLYAQSEHDAASQLPGAALAYEPPEEAELVVRPGDADAITRIALETGRIREGSSPRGAP